MQHSGAENPPVQRLVNLVLVCEVRNRKTQSSMTATIQTSLYRKLSTAFDCIT